MGRLIALALIVTAALVWRFASGRPLSREQGNAFLVSMATLTLCSVIEIVGSDVSSLRAKMLQSDSDNGKREQDARNKQHDIRCVLLGSRVVEKPAQGVSGGKKSNSDFGAHTAEYFPDFTPTFGMLECKEAQAGKYGKRDCNKNSQTVHARTPIDSTATVSGPASERES